MRRAAPLFALALAFAATARADKPRKPKPPLPAVQYPEHETHADEHITIAAEPGDIDSTQPDTRLDYFHHGFLPIRVIVTNDGDKPLTLDDARIKLITSDSTVIQAATDDELQRRLFSQKSVAGTKIPMPGPIPDITVHHKPVDKQILADEADFAFASTTVPPHATVAGYLYYDIREADDPVLDKATLEVRRVHPADSGKDFYAFEIPLKPTPAPPKVAAAPDPKDKKNASKPKAEDKPTNNNTVTETEPKPDNRPHLIPPPDDDAEPPAAPATPTPKPDPPK